MNRVLVKAAFAGVLALLFSVVPARCDSASVNLVSSTGGVYTYNVLVSNVGSVAFTAGDTLTLTGLAGVTGASSFHPSEVSVSLTLTTASAEDTGFGQGANAPVPGGIASVTVTDFLTVDSTSLTIGTIDWELSGPGFSTPLTGTTEGPIAVSTAAPEPGTISLLLSGLWAFGMLVAMRRPNYRSV